MRKLCTVALPFGAAVFLAVYLLPEGIWLAAGLVCAAAGSAAALALRGRCRVRLALIAFGLAAGLLWTSGYSRLFFAPAQALNGQTVPFTATVADWPRETDYGISVLVRLDTGGPAVKTVLYADGRHAGLAPGDKLAGTASFRLSNVRYGRTITYYTSKGVFLLGTVRESEETPLTAERPERPPVRTWPVWAARAIGDSVAAVFPADTGPFAAALLTGDTAGLDGGLKTAFRRTGTAHIVAVSGLHVSFLAGLVTTVLQRRRRLAAIVCAVLLFFFAAVAGNTPSVLRAVFLQCFLLAAPLVGRENDAPTALSAALMLLLAANPFAAASVSLQLSFASVAGIYLVTRPLSRRWRDRLPKPSGGALRRWGRRAAAGFTDSLATTLGALVFTTPLTACYFGSVSLVSPLVNLLTLWAVSDGFLGGLAAALLGLIFPAGAKLLAGLVSLLLRYVLAMSRHMSDVPFAAIPTDSLYPVIWLGMVYALLLLWVLGRKKGRLRPLLPICLCVVALCAALAARGAEGSAGTLTVSVLDVGQGQSILLRSGDALALVDCGGNGLQDAGDTAADAVQALGRTRLDLLILTHCHADHAGGVPQLLDRLEVGAILLPDTDPEEGLRAEILALAGARDIPVILLGENGTAALGEAELTLYAPLGDGGANEEGLSVLCTAGDFDLLITGDMNQVVERRLLKYGDLPDIELLIAGHHGSKHATSEELLLAVRPEYAVISVGDNRYGHPAPETLERLSAAGCEIYRTDWMGTVTVTVRTASD